MEIDATIQAVIFIDLRNLTCLGKFYTTHIEKVIDYILSEIDESIQSVKIIIVEVFNSNEFCDYTNIIEKYNIEILSTIIDENLKDPDDIVIRNLILEYADIPNIKKMVLVSMDGGYTEYLKLAQLADVKIYIAANDRRNFKLMIFNYINLELLRNSCLFKEDDSILSSRISINMLYPKRMSNDVSEFIVNLQNIIKEFEENKKEIICHFRDKTKKEPSL